MKIGMITQWYEPETGAAAHPTAIARALHERGNDVRVLTGYPSYPHGRIQDNYRMGLRHHEQRDGIDIRRVPDYPSHDSSGARRALSLVSFALSATSQVRWLKAADACLVYLTPATVGMAAEMLRRLDGVPYVLYVQDLWPESVTASGFIGSPTTTKRVEGALNRLLGSLYRHASGIAAISPEMARVLEQRAGGSQVEVIYNWVDERIFHPAGNVAPRELDPTKTWVMYAGGIGDVQNLDSAVRALALLPDRPSISLALVGDGVALEGLLSLSEELGVGHRVRALGSRPMESMPPLMSQADAQLVSLRDLPLFRGTVPSKIQSAMATGQPVVCAIRGAAADLIVDAGAGLIAAPGDPESLADAFRELDDSSAAQRKQWGEAARAFYQANLSASVGATRLEALLADAAAERSSR